MRNFADIVAGRPARWDPEDPLILDLHLIKWTAMGRWSDTGILDLVLVGVKSWFGEFDTGDLPGPLRRLRLGEQLPWEDSEDSGCQYLSRKRASAS